MEYDFFNDENQPNEAENSTQRVPAPSQSGNPAPKNKVKWGKVLSSVGLALVIFLGGMFTTWAMLDPQMRTLITVKKKIQNAAGRRKTGSAWLF